MQLQKRGLEAWDERFTHIDVEHFKKGETVDNWFVMTDDIPKSALAEEKNDDSEEEQNESDKEGWSDREDDDEDTPPDTTSPPALPIISTDSVNNEQNMRQQGPLPGSNACHSNKTGASQPRNDANNWYCVSD